MYRNRVHYSALIGASAGAGIAALNGADGTDIANTAFGDGMTAALVAHDPRLTGINRDTHHLFAVFPGTTACCRPE